MRLIMQIVCSVAIFVGLYTMVDGYMMGNLVNVTFGGFLTIAFLNQLAMWRQ